MILNFCIYIYIIYPDIHSLYTKKITITANGFIFCDSVAENKDVRNFLPVLKKIFGGAWVVQLAKCPTLDLGPGQELRVRLCAGSAEPVWDSLSLSLSALTTHTLSLKIKK